MERMGTEYQIFNGKEYVSLRKFWNMEGKYKTEKVKNEELEEENKKLKSDLAYERTMLDNVKAEYKSLQNVIKKLKEEIRFLEQCLDNKEKVNKSLREELSAYDREYFDEDKKAKNIFIDKSGKVIKGGEFTTLC